MNCHDLFWIRMVWKEGEGVLHSKYEWRNSSGDQRTGEELARQMNLSPLVGSILAARGIHDADDVSKLLRGHLEELHDPFLMSGMQEAVPRIRQALEQCERILVYGDYDADGASSTSLMIQLMRRLGADFEYYIPHRSKEGYGLHIPALEQAKARGVSLIITVDTGISAVEQIAFASRVGIDVIVTDHHEPPAQLPQAYALINPKLPYCSYPFKGLAGVGVAYKLAAALLEHEVPTEWLELVAIGTIADLMPLTDENRILVKHGLQSMSRSAFPGVRALLQIAGWKGGEVSSTQVAFGLAPRINASGRMSHANLAVELLTESDGERAEQGAAALDRLNKERQELVEDILEQALEQVEEKKRDPERPDVIVVAGEGWNVGVVGIVASKILERYYRPVIVLAINPETGECKGSARSIPGFDIYEALTDCSDLLHHYGGHPSAAGMSLHRRELGAFEQSLNRYAELKMTPEQLVPWMESDVECALGDITLPALEQLELLAPYGMGNPNPRLMIRGATLQEAKQIGKEGKHLRVLLRQQDILVEAVCFGKGDLACCLSEKAEVDLIAEAGINEWNGSRKPQLLIQDLRVPHMQVFDFRGTRHPIAKLLELIGGLGRIQNEAAESEAVLVNSPVQQEIENQLNELPVWVYDRRIGARLEGLPECTVHPEQVRSLFVLELPDSPVEWNRMLSIFKGLERIYLLHPNITAQEVLRPPSRELFKEVYALLRALTIRRIPEAELLPLLEARTALSRRMLEMVLDVFEELEFVSRQEGELLVNESPSKKPLETSQRYLELARLAEMEQILLHGQIPQISQWLQPQIQGVS
nr:single-stranded-DNA-specific exonuclease RecJ [Paenibacillus brevis]